MLAHRIQGEEINKYWCKLNSSKMPRDIIYKLHDQTMDKMVSQTSDMAKIARDHHSTLLTKDLVPMSLCPCPPQEDNKPYITPSQQYPHTRNLMILTHPSIP